MMIKSHLAKRVKMLRVDPCGAAAMIPTMKPFDRRELIKRSALALSVATLPGFTCQKSDSISNEANKDSKGRRKDPGLLLAPNDALVDGHNNLRLARLGQPQVTRFKIPLKRSHSLIAGLTRGEVLISECGGPSAAVFNFTTGETRQMIQAQDKFFFGGHLTLWRGQNKLVCPEFDPTNPKKSFISIRDTNDGFKEIHRFETRGSRPHSAFILDEGKLLAVQHFDHEPCASSYSSSSKYTYFKLPDFSFIESKTLSGDPNSLKMMANYPSPDVPTDLTAEELKVIAHELEFRKLINPNAQVSATVHPLRKTVLLWRLANLQLISAYKLDNLTPVEASPSGDRKFLLIGTAEGKVLYVNLADKNISQELPAIEDFPLTSHFTVL